jgi:hypothetical protein
MITEDYVSFETAKLLKEKGFREWCFKCYGVAVLYNGADISFDEECELKDEGRENEIEYVEGGRLYDYGCNNRDKDAKVWAAPTLWVTMKWLREEKHYYIQVMLDSWACGGHMGYYVVIQKTDSDFELMLQDALDEVFYATYEEACEAAIKYCLESLI